MTYPHSDHFDGTTFHNVDPLARTRPFREVWKWYRARTPAVWPRWIANGAPHPLPALAPDAIGATWIGHSTFLLRIAGVTILTDPVFAMHAGPFGRLGPRRVRAPAIPLAELPRIDIILQSHNHYDHLDPVALRSLVRRDAPAIVTPLGNRAYLPASARTGAVELDWWQGVGAVKGTKVTLVPAQHFSARTLWDRDRALWGGFVVELAGRAVYFAGDSGYGPHFAEIGRRIPRIDLALLPIGAYEPRWFMGPVHVDPAQAVDAHRDLRAAQSIAMHFGTFQLTDEAIDAPPMELAAALRVKGIAADAFRIPTAGETIILP